MEQYQQGVDSRCDGVVPADAAAELIGVVL
jgi:hypothetical protein